MIYLLLYINILNTVMNMEYEFNNMLRFSRVTDTVCGR
jgi:hypothetical protein